MNVVRLSEPWFSWAVSASWQMALLILFVAGASLLLRRAPARFRYALWTLVLLKAFLPTTLGASWCIGHWGIRPLWEKLQQTRSAKVLGTAPEFPAKALPRDYHPAGLDGESSGSGPASDLGREESEDSASAAASVQRVIPSRPVSSRFSSEPSPLSSFLLGSRPALFLLYLAGLGILLFIVLFRYLLLLRALRRATSVDEGPLRVTIERFAQRLGSPQAPDLFLSESATSPFLVGLFRARIVLPAALPETLTPLELDNVLMHELLHWRRRDLLAGWIQMAVQALFWFHPFVWFANSRLRHEREAACDEAVLALESTTPESYGESLLKVLLASRGRSAVAPGFLGIFERSTRLRERLENIMNHTNSKSKFSWFAWIAIACFALVILPMSSAQAPSQKEKSVHLNAEPKSPQPKTRPAPLKKGWGPEQATGAPDTPRAEDLPTAWAALDPDGGPEWLELDYEPAISANMVRICESFNPGAVVGVELRDAAGQTIAKIPVNDTTREAPAFLEVSFGLTDRPVKTVRVNLDTVRTPGWNEIDAVELVGGTARAWAVAARASSTFATRTGTVQRAAGQPPRIVKTSPPIGATDVSSDTLEITVTFDQDMNGSWSWTGGGEVCPKIPEGKRPFYRDSRTCVLPVALEAGRYYRIGVNSDNPEASNFRSASDVPTETTAIYFATRGATKEVRERVTKPVIVAMDPPNGAKNVDPNLKELRVTFSVEMSEGFSWCGGGPHYPDLPEGGRPRWSEDKKTYVRPVQLKPNWQYQVDINAYSFKNFSSAWGVPVKPVAYTFATGSGTARPAPGSTQVH